MILAKKGMVLVGFLVLGCLLTSVQDGVSEKDATQIGKDATVIIVVKTTDGVIGNGSGFFIRKDLIATNIHVLAGIYRKPITCSAKLVDQPIEYNIISVMASDPEHDLVILKVDGESKNVLPIGNSKEVILNEEVFAIGTHGNNTPGEIVKGTINRITPIIFRVKAALPKGFSGAPVLNNDGDVIAISVSGGKINRYGYAIPSDYLNTLLKDIPLHEQPLNKWREQPSIRAYGIVIQADEKRRLGEYKDAVKSYDSAIFLLPDFAVAYSKRAAVKIKLRDYKGVIKDYDTTILLGKEDVGIYINRCVAKRTLGNYIGAIEDCETAIQLDPENIEAYLNRGDTYAKLRNYEMAIQDYNTALSLNPNNISLAVVYLKRADAKSELGDELGAIEDYSKAIQLKPNRTHIPTISYLNRGITQLNLGKYKEAIKDLDEVISLKPRKDILQNAYMNRATAKSKLDDNIGAIKDYDNAIQLSNNNTKVTAHAYSKRAAAKLALNDNNGAIDDCNTAIGLDPKLSEAYKNRGDAKFNLQNYQDAIKDYDTAIYLQPDYVMAYYQRGNVKVEIGKASEAKTDFRTALKFAKPGSSQSLKDEIEKRSDL